MKFKHKAKKSLGQNFLIDKNIIKKIIKIGNIGKNSNVLEIGSGHGGLTEEIIKKKPYKLIAIEKDKILFKSLKLNYSKFKNLIFINDDVINFLKKNNTNKDVIIYGNLPYNISTQILASLIFFEKWPPWYNSLILMFQKEVADRIIAKSKTKNFGRLSILSNWRLDIQKHFDVSKNSFSPKPKVTSTVLSFTPKKNNDFYLKNPKNLEIVTRILFSNRRKMINKSFKKLFNNSDDVAKKLNINLKQRPEELEIRIFYKIAMEYERLFS